MEEDLVGLGVTDQPDQKDDGGFRRLGVLAGSFCAVAWGLFAAYVFFKEKVTLSNIGFFLFLFLVCFPAYFLPYVVVRAIGRMVGEKPRGQED